MYVCGGSRGATARHTLGHPCPGAPPGPGAAPLSPRALARELCAVGAAAPRCGREKSAHNEALSDVAAVPKAAGGSRGGRDGRKEGAGWPPALATLPTSGEGRPPRGGHERTG